MDEMSGERNDKNKKQRSPGDAVQSGPGKMTLLVSTNNRVHEMMIAGLDLYKRQGKPHSTFL